MMLHVRTAGNGEEEELGELLTMVPGLLTCSTVKAY